MSNAKVGLPILPTPHRREYSAAGTVSEGVAGVEAPPVHSTAKPVTPEPKIPVPPDLVHLKGGHVHETPITESQGMQLKERLSPERFNKGQRLIDQYGAEEGLRRFREMDPAAARQFERHPPISPPQAGGE